MGYERNPPSIPWVTAASEDPRQNRPVGGALAIVFGIVLAVLGLALLSDYRSVGTKILEKTIPNSLQTADPERYRKVLGIGYLAGGIVFIGVGIVVLGTSTRPCSVAGTSQLCR